MYLLGASSLRCSTGSDSSPDVSRIVRRPLGTLSRITVLRWTAASVLHQTVVTQKWRHPFENRFVRRMHDPLRRCGVSLDQGPIGFFRCVLDNGRERRVVLKEGVWTQPPKATSEG